MRAEPVDPGLPPAAHAVVGRAIQDSVVPRLGRAFVPVALALVAGVARFVAAGPDAAGWLLLLGAPATAAAMLAFGLRTVQRAFGRPRRPWMTLARIGALVPPVFGLWVLAWLGLRPVAAWEGAGPVLAGVAMVGIGGWMLVGWVRLVEVQRLASVMATGLE